MIDWSNIEDVTALVEDWEAEIQDWLWPDAQGHEIITETYVSKNNVKFLLLGYAVEATTITKTQLKNKIEQWSTEEIDDIENGWRMGQ